MSDSEPPSTGDVIRAIGGRGCFFIFLSAFLPVAGFLGLIIHGGAERGHSARSRESRNLGSLLDFYYEETGTLPDMVPMEDFATTDQQREILKGAKLFTADPGTSTTLGILNFDDRFDSRMPTDGYTGLPIAYYTDGKGYIVFAPGRDRDFDIKDASQVFSSEKGTDNPLLKKLTNENNREDDGDLVSIRILPTPTSGGDNP